MSSADSSQHSVFVLRAEITHRYNQHPEIFTVFLVQVFVVNFVRAADAQYIPVAPVAQQFESLVDDNVVYDEITKPIHRNTYTDIQPEIIKHQPGHVTVRAGNGENHEERIVFFKKALFPLVVIAVEIPQKAVHHVLMREPGHELHEEERYHGNAYV
jgi:hypothetical protein